MTKLKEERFSYKIFDIEKSHAYKEDHKDSEQE